MTRRSRSFAIAFGLALTLSACGLTDWADTHMPVIGERCEHWQCFTESGQEASRLNEQERLAQQGGGQPLRKPVASNPAANAPASMATTAPAQTQPYPNQAAPPPPAPVSPSPADAPPLAPPMPASGAYVYVPRGPAEPGTTPFDNQSSR